MHTKIRDALRERCARLALQLYAGQSDATLLAELEVLAREHWAFRVEEDA